jgi:hypothetical protein
MQTAHAVAWATVIHCPSAYVFITEGDNQTVTVGETAVFAAVGGPEPGTLTWASDGTPDSGEGTVFVTSFDSVGEKTVTVTWTTDYGETASATATVTVISGARNRE